MKSKHGWNQEEVLMEDDENEMFSIETAFIFWPLVGLCFWVLLFRFIFL